MPEVEAPGQRAAVADAPVRRLRQAYSAPPAVPRQAPSRPAGPPATGRTPAAAPAPLRSEQPDSLSRVQRLAESAAISAGAARRDRDGSLLFTSASAPAPPLAVGEERARPAPTAAPEQLPLQPTPAAGRPAPTPAPTPVQGEKPAQRLPSFMDALAGGPEPAGKERARPSEDQLDDLALRLYPRLRMHLRKDLWLDRERAGLLSDAL